MNVEFVGDLEEILRVLAGHVRDAPYLPFPPKQFVVVERRYLIEMYGINSDNPTLAKARKSIDDYLSARRERDRPIQTHGRPVIFPAHPRRIQFARGSPMGCPAGHDIGPTPPRLQDRDSQRGRTSKAKQSNSLSRLDAGDAQTTKAYDSRTQQRWDVDFIETFEAAGT
jgi:hypothetical protein